VAEGGPGDDFLVAAFVAGDCEVVFRYYGF
jgi:hypothetical protein